MAIGKIQSSNFSFQGEFGTDKKQAKFIRQFSTTLVGANGDSGAIATTKNGNPIGMLIYISKSESVFTPITDILRYFGINIIV